MPLYLRLLSPRPLSPALPFGFGVGFRPLFSTSGASTAGKVTLPRRLAFEPADRLLITKLPPSPRFASNNSAQPQFSGWTEKKK